MAPGRPSVQEHYVSALLPEGERRSAQISNGPVLARPQWSDDAGFGKLRRGLEEELGRAAVLADQGSVEEERARRDRAHGENHPHEDTREEALVQEFHGFSRSGPWHNAPSFPRSRAPFAGRAA